MPLSTPKTLGRANRKARTYHAEIHRLRAAGCTFEVIRQALHEAGIDVSITTVWRESVKALPAPARSDSMAKQFAREAPQSPPAPDRIRSTVHGRDVAESFFAANPSSSLLSSKERT